MYVSVEYRAELKDIRRQKSKVKLLFHFLLLSRLQFFFDCLHEPTGTTRRTLAHLWPTHVNKRWYTLITTQKLEHLPSPQSPPVILSLSSCQRGAHLLCDAIRERRERYLKLSSLIISRIPQDALRDVTGAG